MSPGAPRAPSSAGEDVEAVVEIFAEQPVLHRFFRSRLLVAMTRTSGDHFAAAEPLHLFLLQDPQQLGLQSQIHLGDLVEQQGSS